ncbi:MAG: hypothetical protein NVS3B20_07960 [Polyangiales bacterium]
MLLLAVGDLRASDFRVSWDSYFHGGAITKTIRGAKKSGDPRPGAGLKRS